MSMRMVSVMILGLAIVAGAPALSLAQDKPSAPLQLSGSYQVKNATPSEDGTVNLDFSATISNNGPDDVSGEFLLRDRVDNEKVWGRFGTKTIAAGGSASVSGNVTVPKAIFAPWSGGGAPPLFIYAENSRGDLTLIDIPLVRGPGPSSDK